MSSKSRWASLFGLLALVLCSSGLGQPPPPLTAEQIREIVKAAVDDAIKPVRDSLSGIETRVKTVEAGLSASGRAAVVAETEAAAVAEEVATDAQPPPAQPPAGAAPAVPPAAGGALGQAVPKEFWSVDMAKKTGLYFVEPQITGAVKLLKTAFQKAGDAIPLDVNVDFSANDFMTLQVTLFEEELKKSGRTQEDQLQAWRNFWADWNNQQIEALTREMDKAKRRMLFKQAFTEGARDMVDWAEAVEKAHDEGTAGTIGTAGAGGSGSGARSIGYLPPLAAYHHAKYLRRMHRLQGRIQAYRSY